MTAAACRTSPPAEPEVTSPASAPVISAMTLPAATFRSSRLTMVLDAFSMESRTSGLSLLPPYCVVEPDAAITGLAPRLR